MPAIDERTRDAQPVRARRDPLPADSAVTLATQLAPIRVEFPRLLSQERYKQGVNLRGRERPLPDAILVEVLDAGARVHVDPPPL